MLNVFTGYGFELLFVCVLIHCTSDMLSADFLLFCCDAMLYAIWFAHAIMYCDVKFLLWVVDGLNLCLNLILTWRAKG